MADTHGRSQFLSALRVAQESEIAVAVYADTDEADLYEVGFVENVDSNDVTLKCLTPRGEPDGRRVIRMDDISRVESETAYTKKLELLYQYRDTIFDKDFRKATTGDLKTQLEHARDHHALVHLIDASDGGPNGFITEVGEDYVTMLRVSRDGEPDGKATILMDSIQKVHIGRRQDQVIEFLYRYNFELKNLLER